MELFLLVLISVYYDTKYSKIKNFVVYPAVVVGITTNLILSGIYGVKDSLFGTFAPIAILFIFYAVRFLGAGDVKLFGAIGAIMGLKFILYCIAYSFLFGGFIAVIIMVIRKNTVERFKKLFNYLKALLIFQRLEKYQDFDENKAGLFRFSYAILGGTIISVIDGLVFRILVVL